MTVGERIRELRERLGINQVDFADKIGVSKQTLYKYENNLITNIPSDKIEAAAKLGNISPSYLMGWESTSDIRNAEDKRSGRLWKYYNLLHKDGQDKVLTYTQNLLNLQNAEDAAAPTSIPFPATRFEVNAAHDDRSASDEDRKAGDAIMTDDSEWE